MPSGSKTPRAAGAVFFLVAILRGWMGSGLTDPARTKGPDEQDHDFSGVLSLAIRTKTLGLLKGGFDRSGAEPPHGLSDELARRQEEILTINLRALMTISKLAHSFDQADLPYAVIKGPLRAEQVYGAMDVRFGSDIDVLTDPNRYREALRLIEDRMDYTCLVPPDDRWWHDFLGEAPLAGKDRGAPIIDLHNQLQQPGGPYPASLQGFLDETQTRAIGSNSARILSAQNALMLTAISYGKALRNAEPWIAYAHEICYALHTLPPSAEEELRVRARDLRIGRLFDEFLRASKALFDTPIRHDSSPARQKLAMSACGYASPEFLGRSKASWRWTEGTGPTRLGTFASAIVREAKGRLSYRASTKFD